MLVSPSVHTSLFHRWTPKGTAAGEQASSRCSEGDPKVQSPPPCSLKVVISTRWSWTATVKNTMLCLLENKKGKRRGLLVRRKLLRYPSINPIEDMAYMWLHDDPAQTLATWAVGTRHHSCMFWYPWWKWAENLTVPFQEVFLLVLMRLKYLVPQMSGLAPAAWEIANYCSVSLIFWFN